MDATAKKSGGWNYRIMRHVDERAANIETWYTMHEVYYDADGKVDRWTAEPCGSPCGETLEEMTGDLAWILVGLTKPVLDFKTGLEIGDAAILADDLTKFFAEKKAAAH